MKNGTSTLIKSKLEQARIILTEESVSLVMISDEIYRRSGKGILPLYELLNSLQPHQIQDAVLADKVVGKAAALLAINAKLSAIYAQIISHKAIELLDQHNVYCQTGYVVDIILNNDRSGMCPMESLTKNIDSPNIAQMEIGKQLDKWANQNRGT